MVHSRSTPCLVAHNGAMFDFVILREEARRSLVQLPTGWAVVDTLRMAQVLDWSCTFCFDTWFVTICHCLHDLHVLHGHAQN